MNLQELRTFLAIVETGSLVGASQVLNVTQSTVTARLQSLEGDIGQTLVLRQKSGATLTAAGTKMHRYADTIVKLWQQAQQESGLPVGISGICNLACEHALWPNLGERLVQELHDQYPEFGLSIWVGNQSEVARWLDEGKSDLAFTYRPATSAQQSQMVIRPDELILVSTKPDSPIRFDPLYVFVDHGEAFGRDHSLAYADADTARISFGNSDTAMAHILNFGGSAYLPRRFVDGHLADGGLFQLPDAPTFSREVFLTYDARAREAWYWFDSVLAGCAL